jgi:hypothetical protein
MGLKLGLAQRGAEPPHSLTGLDALGGPKGFILSALAHVRARADGVVTATAKAIIISLRRLTAFRATNADDAIAWPRRIAVGKHRRVVDPVARALLGPVEI